MALQRDIIYLLTESDLMDGNSCNGAGKNVIFVAAFDPSDPSDYFGLDSHWWSWYDSTIVTTTTATITATMNNSNNNNIMQ